MTKKEKILQAAIDEFAEKDYMSASTNAIVERAGASKGLLFHYYGSKDKLFIRCFSVAMDAYTSYIFVELENSGPDLFDILMHSLEKKLEWMYDNERYGKVMDSFCTAAYFYRINGFFEIIEAYISNSFDKVMRICDKARFRRDVPLDYLVRYVTGIFTSLSTNVYSSSLTTYEEKLETAAVYMRDIQTMIELMKHGVYER